ncbi:hypothetical protein C3369_11290 [Escherichia sp. ESNIH1]|uniref:hypothetical protein n=1 Tax=Escherichia sp. ESNIH1 TaxID=1985876 RepID=UPI000CDE03AB|nr:hypothetical protein [Escherichia sp. ESNIH1]POU02040.1 hypothetical protein C3369_11290 [Escherichia sp. ESNIH1]
MLENYYGAGISDKSTPEQKRRLLAVQAALEIAKAAAPGGSLLAALNGIDDSLDKAADAIQAALSKSK